MAKSYLAELLGRNDEVSLKNVYLSATIIRVDIRSRHSESVSYRTYVEYEPSVNNDANSIKRYYCECKNGARTAGCCSHVATVLYYLSWARWQEVIPRPAEKLTDLFVPADSGSDDEDGMPE